MQTQITPYCSECGSRCDIYPYLNAWDTSDSWHSTCCNAPVESSSNKSYEWGELQNYYLWCQSFEVDAPINPNL